MKWDSNEPILTDFSERSDTLLIAFGGIKGGLAIPVFEFFTLTGHYPVKKMYVRDLTQSWYQNKWDETLDTLKKHQENANVKKTVVIGNSAGGFAALTFGTLLHAERVHAFAPQTYLNTWNRLLTRDFRWRKEIRHIKNRKTLDAKAFIKTHPGKTIYHIHYDCHERLDALHAERMKELPSVVLHPYQKGGHNVISELKKEGELERIIQSTLEDPL